MRLVQDLILFVCLFTLLGSQLPGVSQPAVALWEHIGTTLANLH